MSSEQEALRIHQDMALAPGKLLAAIRPAHTAHERLDRLAIGNHCTRGGVSSCMQPGRCPQLRIDADPVSILTLLTEIPIDSLSWAILARQVTPGAAAAHDIVEDGAGRMPILRL